MIKELKFFFYILIIFIFIFFTTKYYFSNDNKKKSYRSITEFNSKIEKYTSTLPLLKSDTDEIIEYIGSNKNKNKKKYFFWNLLQND